MPVKLKKVISKPSTNSDVTRVLRKRAHIKASNLLPAVPPSKKQQVALVSSKSQQSKKRTSYGVVSGSQLPTKRRKNDQSSGLDSLASLRPTASVNSSTAGQASTVKIRQRSPKTFRFSSNHLLPVNVLKPNAQASTSTIDAQTQTDGPLQKHIYTHTHKPTEFKAGLIISTPWHDPDHVALNATSNDRHRIETAFGPVYSKPRKLIVLVTYGFRMCSFLGFCSILSGSTLEFS